MALACHRWCCQLSPASIHRKSSLLIVLKIPVQDWGWTKSNLKMKLSDRCASLVMLGAYIRIYYILTSKTRRGSRKGRRPGVSIMRRLCTSHKTRLTQPIEMRSPCSKARSVSEPPSRWSGYRNSRYRSRCSRQGRKCKLGQRRAGCNRCR